MNTKIKSNLKLMANRADVQKVKRAITGCAVFAEGMLLSGMTVFADQSEPTTILLTVMDQIVKLFPLIGIVIAAVGAFKLFMAFRNDQPDAYSGAVKDIVIGAALITFKAFIWDVITNNFQ